MLSKEDRVLIEVVTVEKGYVAKRIMKLNFQEETGRLLPVRIFKILN